MPVITPDVLHIFACLIFKRILRIGNYIIPFLKKFIFYIVERERDSERESEIARESMSGEETEKQAPH